MLFLIIQELIDYTNPFIKKQTLVNDPKDDQNSTGNNQIKANFSLRFYSVPCAILCIDKEDLSGNHILDIKNNINKVRMSYDNKEIVGSLNPYKVNLLTQAISDKEGCYITSSVDINKSPGDIHISFHNYREAYDYLMANQHELFKTLNLNHKFLTLNFGDETITEEILHKFNLNKNNKAFINDEYPIFENDNDFDKEAIYNYDYYLKLIQHIFIDEIKGEKYIGYQYSISSKKKVKESEDEMPIIMINYDLSPIIMKFILSQKSLTRVLTHICAIVGGVFVIFSIINRILLSLFDWLKYKQSL
jgi:hypothetical protein